MKLANFIIAGIIATSIGTLGITSRSSAVSRSSSSRSSHSYSSHTSTTHHTVSPPTWSSSRNYGSGKISNVGTKPLKSNTPAPKPHTYEGKTYNSSQAIYTNTSGIWVYYWLATNHQTQCFDKNHKHVSCERNSKSVAKDW